MMRSMFSGVSGLKNHQTRMDMIGNNIANVNTTGFKGSRVTFQDMLTQTLSGASGPQGNLGGTNPQQIGLGVGLASIDTIFTDGSVQSTGKNTDLCITGNGFFVVSDGMKDYYTRNGAFEFDKDGNFVLPGSGLHVKGWMADTEGNVSTSGQITNIVVPSGQTMPSAITTKTEATGNLSATEKAPTTETKTGLRTSPGSAEPVVGTTTAEDGTVTEVLAGSVNYLGGYWTTSVTLAAGVVAPKAGDIVYDNAGAAVGTVTRVTGNTFEYLTNDLVAASPGDVYYQDPAGNYQSYGTANTAAAVEKKVYEYDAKITTPGASKTASFKAYDSQGIEHIIEGTLTKTATNTWEFQAKTLASTGAVVTGKPIVVEFDEKGKCIAGTGSVMITPLDPPLGSDSLNVNIDFTALTQYSGTSSLNFASDGNAAGTLETVSFDSAGMVIGSFSNGQKRNLAQVAMATFNNPGGLEKSGSSLYTQSNNSGEVQINPPGVGGAGKLTPAATEMSNVNLSDQFSDMIITQRGFQSNSKIITVSDEMIETLVNMKR